MGISPEFCCCARAIGKCVPIFGQVGFENLLTVTYVYVRMEASKIRLTE